jgi:hypothetical protein
MTTLLSVEGAPPIPVKDFFVMYAYWAPNATRP